MKKHTTKKYLVLFVSAAFLVTGCKDKYQEGFNAGLSEGTADGRAAGLKEGAYDGSYATGKEDGRADGLAEGQAYYVANSTFQDGYEDGYAMTYQNGVNAGYSVGLDNGYDAGYDTAYDYHFDRGDSDGYADGYDDGAYNGAHDGASDGYNDGYAVGETAQYQVGYSDGYEDGDYDGYQDGYADGSVDGYDAGYEAQYDVGYNDGYDDGETAGYNDGYDDGYYDAEYGYAAKSSNPTVKMAAMVNADLIDYANLQKFDAKAAASSGLVMNHADSGTVDMEKLASLKEQHYLNQMSEQLQARFGLNASRAKDIATVAHQFNKLSGSRELTEKDANVFAVSVIGKNLKDVEAAVTESMKGNSDSLNEMLNEIAAHNQTSPENVNRIIGEIFF